MSITREYKGDSLLRFPADFVVLDLETTGLDPSYDSIIEIGALRIRDWEVVDRFSSLVNPGEEIDEFITQLTGITNEMLATAPPIETVLPLALEFIGADIVVAHNANFDVNFLYDWRMKIAGNPFKNDFVDTLRLSRRLLPELPHHRLSDLMDAFGVQPDAVHRSVADCASALSCFARLKEIMLTKYGGEEKFATEIARSSHGRDVDLRTLSATSPDAIDPTSPLFGKTCVFTGALSSMTREQAAQLVINVGGLCANGVNRNTNFLVLGNSDYRVPLKNGKSNKRKKAEEMKLKGFDIEILSEDAFFDMLK